VNGKQKHPLLGTTVGWRTNVQEKVHPRNNNNSIIVHIFLVCTLFTGHEMLTNSYIACVYVNQTEQRGRE